MTEQVTLFRDNQTGLTFAAEVGEVTPVSWQPPAELTFEEWTAIGNTLQQVNASLNWWIGDWLNYGEHKWGEMYAQAVEVTGWEYQRLANAKWVADRVQFSLRQENLRWSHHSEVANMQPEEQHHWLRAAADGAWSVRQLREAIKASKQLPTPVPTITAIPAQPYTNGNGNGHTNGYANGNGYHAEEIDDTEELPFTTFDYSADEDEPEPVAKPSPMAVHFSSDSPEHYTPAAIVDAVIDVFGEIDLDPCSNSKDAPNVPALYHYTVEDDGLSLPWVGKVYMNPPYGRSIGEWVNKLTESLDTGVTEAIALVPARVDTQWWNALTARYSMVCFVSGRLTFIGNKDAAPFPSAVVYLSQSGENALAFYDMFSQFGRIWQELPREMIAE